MQSLSNHITNTFISESMVLSGVDNVNESLIDKYANMDSKELNKILKDYNSQSRDASTQKEVLISKLQKEATEKASLEKPVGTIQHRVLYGRILNDMFVDNKKELDRLSTIINSLSPEIEQIKLAKKGHTKKYNRDIIQNMYKDVIGSVPELIIPIRKPTDKITADDYWKSTIATFVAIVPDSLKHLTDEYFLTNYGIKENGLNWDNDSLATSKYTKLVNDEIKKYFNSQKSKGEHTQSPKSNSEYVLYKNGNLLRLSDHWGSVASCEWNIDDVDKSNIVGKMSKVSVKNYSYYAYLTRLSYYTLAVQNLKNFKSQPTVRFTKIDFDTLSDFSTKIKIFKERVAEVLTDNEIFFSKADINSVQSIVKKLETCFDDAQTILNNRNNLDEMTAELFTLIRSVGSLSTF